MGQISWVFPSPPSLDKPGGRGYPNLMRMKSPPFKALLPLLFGLIAAAPPAPKFLLDFRAICPFDASLCLDYDTLSAELNAEAGRKLGSVRVSSLNGKLIDMVRRTDEVVYRQPGLKIEAQAVRVSVYGGLELLRQKVNMLSRDSAPDEKIRLYQNLMTEERRADELMADLNGPALSGAAQQAAAGRFTALNADATRTWEEVRAFALNVDRLGSPLNYQKNIKLGLSGKLVAESINPLQERVAGLRDRLLKIKQAFGSVSPDWTTSETAAYEAVKGVAARLAEQGLDRDIFEHKAAQYLPNSEVVARPQPPNERPISAGVDLERYHGNLTVSSKILLDNRPPPEVAKPTAPLPPRNLWQKLTGAFPLFWGDRDAFPEETKKIAKLRAAGKTATIGDPGGRAQYVFPQTGGTCALAAQAQIYAEAHGIKPTRAAMEQIEAEFFVKASVTKQFNGNSDDPNQRWNGDGTNVENIGNMLDTPIKKHYLAKDEELFAAVSRGKMVMIVANAGLLWNDKRRMSKGHAVVVTGAEVDSAGALLGYYINDTGTNEAARFVSAKQFLPAWQTLGSVFIEPL